MAYRGIALVRSQLLRTINNYRVHYLVEILVLGLIYVVVACWILCLAFSKANPRYEITKIIKRAFALGIHKFLVNAPSWHIQNWSISYRVLGH